MMTDTERLRRALEANSIRLKEMTKTLSDLRSALIELHREWWREYQQVRLEQEQNSLPTNQEEKTDGN